MVPALEEPEENHNEQEYRRDNGIRDMGYRIRKVSLSLYAMAIEDDRVLKTLEQGTGAQMLARWTRTPARARGRRRSPPILPCLFVEGMRLPRESPLVGVQGSFASSE